MSSIFLSHSSQDNGIADQVKARLEQWGYQVFLDFHETDGIPAGHDWKKELYAKLRQCRTVIILCSHASMASRWCFAEVTHADAQGKRVIPIKIDEVQIDPILTSVQIIDATAGWDEAYRRLKEGLKDLFEWNSRRPPYPGLPAFQEEDAAIFFGRDKEIRDMQALLNRLQQFGGPRLTLMLGASGSGKSSLMRAGLLPRLKRDQRWVVINPFRPLKAPFDELVMVLSQRFAQLPQSEKYARGDVASIRDRIRWEEQDTKQSVDAFLELLKELRAQAGAQHATVLLMIDQCEELLTLAASDEGHRFLAFLRTVLDREDNHLLVLATLRSDFLGSFQDHPAIRGLRVEPFAVPQMQVDDFASVIEGPAKIGGLELGPGLVQAMISDTKTSDALPLLSFTLRELYEGYGQDDKHLTLEEYRDKLGRLDGCIARAAEAVLSANPLSEKEVSDLHTAFLSMARVADNEQYTKQPVPWNDLPAGIQHVLERFVTARLLISSGAKNGRTIEVAHEALFRAWPRLVGWLEDNKAFLVWLQRLNTTIKEWNKNQESHDLLLRGLPLREALEWLKKKPESFSARERQFVTASKTHLMRSRWLSAAVVGVLFIIVGGPLLWLEQQGVTLKYTSSVVRARLHLISVLEPDMVTVLGGVFQQGNSELGARYEQPVRQVTVKPFAIGKYEVTFQEYDRYAELIAGRSPSDESWGRGTRPVINISWEDAKAYAKWLSQATGKQFRLPTESEWEYAARNGGKDEKWAGTSNEEELKRYAVFDITKHTEPVGSKTPNGLQLYDMSGNVSEWLEDCWHYDYTGAPVDGSAWLEETNGGHCDRVVRGGGWYGSPVTLGASFRHQYSTDDRKWDLGFRLAQDLEP